MPTDPTTVPLSFAYWVPNVSGGLVTSTIEQRTDWSFDYNRKLAILAERAGFEYALSQVRYTASYGAEFQHESTSFSLALLLATERLKLIAAVHPGLWHPGVLAKWVASADHLSNGRVAVNVVSGWFKDEFRQLGEPWLEHDERYRRSGEFIQALKLIWTSEDAQLAGDFYRIRDFNRSRCRGPAAPTRRSSRGAIRVLPASTGGATATGISRTASRSRAFRSSSTTSSGSPPRRVGRTARGSASMGS